MADSILPNPAEHSVPNADVPPIAAIEAWSGPALHVAALDHLQVIDATGADTWTFLQSQLTQDVAKLPADQAKLAGYCTAKGRLLANFVVWSEQPPAETPRAFALLDASLSAGLLKRLSMFVLRAKVKLGVTERAAYGVQARVAANAAALVAMVGELPSKPWSRVELASGTWIAAPAQGDSQRWWWIASAEQHSELLARARGILEPGDVQSWRRADIAAGLPWIEAATQDMFVPQSVNLELVDGVSFTKGCYPGQEVVARSHYLGKLKRRMFAGIAHGAADPASLVGADVFHSERDNEPSGRVVNAALAGDGVALLLESTLASVQSGSLSLATPDGAKIELRALPYAFPG